jgi:hypothetical protein
MTDETHALLDALTPTFADEQGDWQRVLDDAARPAGRSVRSQRRRPLVLVGIAVALVACPAAIAVSAHHGWWWSHGLPRKNSPVSSVLSRSWEGKRWTLSAYLDDRQGLCYGVEAPTKDGTTALSCDRINGLPPRQPGSLPLEPHDLTYLAGSAGLHGSGWVAGMTSPTITSVAVHFTNGATIRSATTPAPPSLHTRVRFFLIRAPQGLVPGGSPANTPRALGLAHIGGYRSGELVTCLDIERFRLRAPLSRCQD